MIAGGAEVVRPGVKMRSSGRKNSNLREIKITKDFISNQPAALLYEQGRTRIICSATYTEKVPLFAKEKKRGWVSAEYSMLPYSTGRQRFFRERSRTDNRNIEIQRFIGRALRSAIDLKKTDGFNITVDADVIEADGGTRCASVNGGMIALIMLLKHLVFENKLYDLPDFRMLAAVSVGIRGEDIITDLDYEEDSEIDADINIVSSEIGEIIEVQGVAEEGSVPYDLFRSAIEKGVEKNFEIIKKIKDSLK